MNDMYASDRDLVARLVRGDGDAFDAFVDEFYPRLYRFAHARMRTEPDSVQEVVQASFAKIIQKISLYRGEASVFTWMCSFCRFEIAAHWRKKGRRSSEQPLIEDSSEIRAALESLAAEVDGPVELAERRELARMVRLTLDHLPLRYGNALDWKYLQGLSVRQVAARLGSTEKAAESVLTRARQVFRNEFVVLAGGQKS